MENLNQTPNNTPEPTNPQVDAESKGPTVGIIIIVLILILGFIYIFFGRENRIDLMETNDASEEQLLEQSDSTELEDIEMDADNTDLDNLDAELREMEAELELNI